jgi:CMP-2-keto-3-deoxyoctulosonic acid synthetase
MADQKDTPITYDEVINAAQSILKKGERYTLEKIRRYIGKGSHSQIAEILRKWQTSKHSKNKNKNNAQQSRHSKRPHKPAHQHAGFQHGQRDFTETYQQIKPSEPFSEERLEQESVLIQSLFLAVYTVREKKSEALERHQRQQNDLQSMQMRADQEVIQIQKSARSKINILLEEHARIRTQRERDIEMLRAQSESSY